MNYATIEEAWAKPKSTSLNKIPVSSVKHPLLAKAEMDDNDPMEATKAMQQQDPDEDDIKNLTGLRKALRRLYDARGSFGVELVLPKGYVDEQRATKNPSSFGQFESLADIEEVAKWMLMAAVVYIIFDLAR